MNYQTSLLRGQPDDEAMREIKYFEKQALEKDERGYCVCSSEGKDSRVVGHLMRRAGVKHFYVHNITGIDPPELVYFKRKNFEDYRNNGYLTYNTRAQYTIWQLMLKNRFPPLRQMRYCCKELKEYRAKEHGNAFISLGVRRAEGTKRKKSRGELEYKNSSLRAETYSFDNTEGRSLFELCTHYTGEFRLNPIAEWTDADVWSYSEEQNLEQCYLYKEKFERLGCIGCPMASEKTRRAELERWQGFKRLYIRTFDTIIALRKQLGFAPLPCESGEELLEWWLTDKKTAQIDEEQLNMWQWETDEYVR